MAERDRAGLTAVGGGDSGIGGPSPGAEAWTASEGRRFGLIVGACFLALSGLFWWQGHGTFAWVAGALGGTLGLAGVAVPGRLHPVYRAWMAAARAISRITTPVVLSLVYFLVLTPTGLLRRHLGSDPLERNDAGGTYWRTRSDGDRSDLRRQF